MVRFYGFLKFLPSIVFFLIINQLFVLSAENSKPNKLLTLMEDIDRSYKASEVISGYYNYSEEDWDTIYDSGVKIAELTKQVQDEFARPDDKEYQRLMEQMRVEAQKMADIAKKNRGQEGSLEDVQWQVRKLRNTCANCHRLLNIHIYPQLYPQKKQQHQDGIFKDWGKPDD